MKSTAASSVIVLWLLYRASTVYAASVECSAPPGPSGRITCQGDYVPFCEATGRRIEGQCLKKPPTNDIEEINKWLIGKMLITTPISPQEIHKYEAGLSKGQVLVGKSVFTFNLDTHADNTIEETACRSRLLVVALWGIALAIVVYVLTVRKKSKRDAYRQSEENEEKPKVSI